jgi:Domain of unknown function (DUF4167)
MRCWPLGRKQGQAADTPPVLIFVLLVQYGAYFTRHYQGVSHAEWPKNIHHYAPTQIGGVICCPLKAADLERSSSRAEELSNAQRSYERYLALARAEAQSGDMIGAENYYQHAEHYFRSMSSDLGTT